MKIDGRNFEIMIWVEKSSWLLSFMTPANRLRPSRSVRSVVIPATSLYFGPIPGPNSAPPAPRVNFDCTICRVSIVRSAWSDGIRKSICVRIRPSNNEFRGKFPKYQSYYNMDCNSNTHDIDVFSYDSSCRTEMGLLKPSGQAERTIDALAHYHKRTSRTREVSSEFGDGIAAELSWNYYFPCIIQYRLQG